MKDKTIKPVNSAKGNAKGVGVVGREERGKIKRMTFVNSGQ
jgi:hypothetical protein